MSGHLKRQAMWNLKKEEIARRILASELSGVWDHDLRGDEGTIAVFLVDCNLGRVLEPGLVRANT